MLLDNDRGRPTANRAAPHVADLNLDTVMVPPFAPARPQDSGPSAVIDLPKRTTCGHDAGADCSEHGCPFCRELHEQHPWIEPCATCARARAEVWTRWLEANPAAACELEDCVHCLGCGRCARTGAVCARCRRCTSCLARPSAPDPVECESWRWDAEQGADVATYAHLVLDVAAGHWREAEPTPPHETVHPLVSREWEHLLEDQAARARWLRRRRTAHLRRVACRYVAGERCISCGPDRDLLLERIAHDHEKGWLE